MHFGTISHWELIKHLHLKRAKTCRIHVWKCSQNHWNNQLLQSHTSWTKLIFHNKRWDKLAEPFRFNASHNSYWKTRKAVTAIFFHTKKAIIHFQSKWLFYFTLGENNKKNISKPSMSHCYNRLYLNWKRWQLPLADT